MIQHGHVVSDGGYGGGRVSRLSEDGLLLVPPTAATAEAETLETLEGGFQLFCLLPHGLVVAVS